MADLATQPAPPVQDALERRIQGIGTTIVVVAAAAALIFPGIVLGSIAAAVWRTSRKPSTARRAIVAVVPVALVPGLADLLSPGWLWRALLWPGSQSLFSVPPISAWSCIRSAAVEAMAGPAILEIVLLARRLMVRSVAFQLRRYQREEKRRTRAVQGSSQVSATIPRLRRARTPDMRHPGGRIRLGVDCETNRPFDLYVPNDLAAHVFLPGVSGAGKTTTLARLIDGALANGYGTVIVDCKGGGLKATAQSLARQHGVPFFLVDPDDPTTLGYNPCSGDAPGVANKLVGAFTYGPSAEIYKHVAMEAIPVIVRGLAAAGEPVTLEALYDACTPRGMVRLVTRVPAGVDDRTRTRLTVLGAPRKSDQLSASGHAGLQRRFGALLEGKFGDLFRADSFLSWDAALALPAVTYISLSTLATGEDVELLGRVIAQDLKQACARRLAALGRAEPITPTLTVFDEFAALREADQLADLLRQAREALMPTVVSTQYIPKSLDIAKSVLGAGLLISHRVEAEDAEVLAGAFGTRPWTELTIQHDFETGYTQKGSVRNVQAFRVHPNDLRDLLPGCVAVRSASHPRPAIVQVVGHR